MVYAWAGEAPLDYLPCRYGTSRLVFRGPPRALDRPYAAVLGGTESYGKFIPRPWPVLAEDASGVPMVNLACVNAGADAYLSDEGVLRVAQGARAAVMQVMGAANLSNTFYAVHPRRNDRFLRALPPLVRLYPEVDFTAIHFTRHLLLTLRRVSADRFAEVTADLRRTWAMRTADLIDRIGVPVLLLWLATRPPGPAGDEIGPDPLLVDTAMLAAVRTRAAGYIEAVVAPAADPVAEGLAFAADERAAAAVMPGPCAHAVVADRVTRALAQLG